MTLLEEVEFVMSGFEAGNGPSYEQALDYVLEERAKRQAIAKEGGE